MHSIQPSAGTLIRCSIEPADIKEMNYWLAEAPMADPTRQNAFSFALQRILIPDIKVVVHRRVNQFEASIGKRLKFKLSPALSSELQRAFIGHEMKPIVEWLRLPWTLLRPSVQSALRRVHAENTALQAKSSLPRMAA
jgi:hypothetical protein